MPVKAPCRATDPPGGIRFFCRWLTAPEAKKRDYEAVFLVCQAKGRKILTACLNRLPEPFAPRHCDHSFAEPCIIPRFRSPACTLNNQPALAAAFTRFSVPIRQQQTGL